MAMSGNPKDSPWRSTPQRLRKRKSIVFTISDEARERLKLLAPEGTRSAFVERLILDHPLPKGKT